MIINTNFNFLSDARGGDPDITSQTLRKYHKFLWSKPLPNGTYFELRDDMPGAYLYHKSHLGEFFLGSDAITHSYKNHKRKKYITELVPEVVDELFNAGCTIGAYVIFPNRQIGRKYTINQARGINRLIDDRFDLTLECIRRFYLGEQCPLYGDLLRYKAFFDLFGDFPGYVHFFLLDDLVDSNFQIRFFLPFDNFQTRPTISDVDQYLSYAKRVLEYIQARNRRIDRYARSSIDMDDS